MLFYRYTSLFLKKSPKKITHYLYLIKNERERERERVACMYYVLKGALRVSKSTNEQKRSTNQMVFI